MDRGRRETTADSSDILDRAKKNGNDLSPDLNHMDADDPDDHDERGNVLNSISKSTDLSFVNDEDTPAIRRKRNEIKSALSSKPVDRARLRQLALSEHGLVDDKLRRQAWPLLITLDESASSVAPTQAEIEAHSEYRQVVMDVNRSLKRFPPGIPYDQRVALQDQLTRLILRVIMKYPHLCYYQGYHDVAVTFLLVVGEDAAFNILERLSTEHLRECMEPTMDTTSHLLNTIYPLIARRNPSLLEHLEKSEVGTLFCLPWFLTWFGHSLSQYSTVVRLYDFFLCSAPRFPLYVAAAIVLHRTEDLLSTPGQMDCMHLTLSQLPEDLPFEQILKEASSLYEDFPPESIENEVIERTNKELEMRKRPMINKSKTIIKNNAPAGVGHLFLRCRQAFGIPRPRNYVQILVATASVVFSVYMYMRTSGMTDTLALPGIEN